MLQIALDVPDLTGAACVGTDPDVWFSTPLENSVYQNAGSTRKVSSVVLLAICYSCPVQRRCRDWTLSVVEAPHWSGVVGGLRPADRRLLWKWRHDPDRHAELLEALIAYNRPPPRGERRPPLPEWAR